MLNIPLDSPFNEHENFNGLLNKQKEQKDLDNLISTGEGLEKLNEEMNHLHKSCDISLIVDYGIPKFEPISDEHQQNSPKHRNTL